MADTSKLTIVKSFTYRGAPEEWSNSYHFLGPDPDPIGDAIDALASAEAAMFPLAVTYERAYYYRVHDDATRGPVDVVHDLGGAHGSFDPTGLGAAGFSGDVAAVVRWKTDTFTTGTHPKRIYLRKYYHSVFGASDPVSDQDALLADQRTSIHDFADELRASVAFAFGQYCGPRGVVAGDVFVSPWVTTRTLKRRGRRPPR